MTSFVRAGWTDRSGRGIGWFKEPGQLPGMAAIVVHIEAAGAWRWSVSYRGRDSWLVGRGEAGSLEAAVDEAEAVMRQPYEPPPGSWWD